MQGGDVAVTAEIDLADALHGRTVEVSYEAVAPCEHCRGNGAEPGTPIETCPRCQGTGQLRAVTRTPFGQVMRTTVCDTCHGDGRVPREPCQVCRGRGRKVDRPKVSVDIPAGIADGQRIRVSGRGHAGERGGPPGDLYVLVRVREDPRFLRDGDDLVTAVDVAAPLAALGTTVKVPTVDGEVELEIPAGTQPHETLVVRGAGMPALRGRRTGDLRVVVNVVIPRHLSREQRELLEELAGVDDRAQPPHRRGRVRKAQARLRALSMPDGAPVLPTAGRPRSVIFWATPSGGLPGGDDPPGGARAPRAGRAGARRAARARAERGRGGRGQARTSSSTRSTARRASCPRCPTCGRRRAGRWSRSHAARSPTTGRSAGASSTGRW